MRQALARAPTLAYTSVVNVAALQFDIAWENKPANFGTVKRLLTEAAPEKNSLVVLPEMFATGFSMNADAIAEPYGGVTEQFLASTAKEFGICLMAGAAMRTRWPRTKQGAGFLADRRVDRILCQDAPIHARW